MRLAALAVVAQAGLVLLLSGGRVTLASGLLAMVGAIIVGVEAGAQRAPDPEGAPLVDRVLAMLTSLGTALSLIGGPLLVATDPEPSGGLLALGCTLALVGSIARRLAITTLEGAFVTAAQRPVLGLVTHGVFRRLRHPSELGLWLIAAGMLVAAVSTATALGCALVVGSSALRMRREDRLLAAAFGDEWTRWSRRAGAITPRMFGA